MKALAGQSVRNVVGPTTLGKALFGVSQEPGHLLRRRSPTAAISIGSRPGWGDSSAQAAVIGFGAGAIGAFRGLVAGGAISALQSLILE
jgi:hypothetical protein